MPRCGLREGGGASFCLQINMLEYDTLSHLTKSALAHQSSAKIKGFAPSKQEKQLQRGIWGHGFPTDPRIESSSPSAHLTQARSSRSVWMAHGSYRNDSLSVNPSASVVISMSEMRKWLAETYTAIQRFEGFHFYCYKTKSFFYVV